MKRLAACGLLTLAASLCLFTPALHAANPDDFLVFNYNLYDDASTPDLYGRLFVPSTYDPAKKYPLVIFYHGLGETISNSPDGINTAQVNGNIDNLLAAAKNRDKASSTQSTFFIYAPQAGSSWNTDTIDRALGMVAKATTLYSIDTSRLYVTGLSLGGGATWDTAINYDGVFAAAAPICGANSTPSDPSKNPQNFAKLTNEPVWAFHARDDGTVNVSYTRNRINAIRAADGKSALTFPPSSDKTTQVNFVDGNLRYTEYATGNHGIWGSAYKDQSSTTYDLYDWMLAQQKPLAKPALNQTLYFDFGNTKTLVADSQGRLWNSTPYAVSRTSGPGVSFAMDSAGNRTSVIVDILDTFSGDNGNGLTAGSIYDNDIALDSWYTGSSSHSGALAAPGIVAICGLTPFAAYHLELFASRSDNDGGRGRITRYTIGDQYQDLNVEDNLSRKAIFDAVYADATGTLTLTVCVPTDGTSRYGYLGAMELTAIPEPATAAILLPLALPLLCRRSLRKNN